MNKRENQNKGIRKLFHNATFTGDPPLQDPIPIKFRVVDVVLFVVQRPSQHRADFNSLHWAKNGGSSTVSIFGGSVLLHEKVFAYENRNKRGKKEERNREGQREQETENIGGKKMRSGERESV